ncbi:conjugal transfer protein [Streptomyces lincolnensis]|uniref:conjugal transfer protein n=1 Tax=Streptomyces lincolnensis TaxID=1915 RepID=UPI001E6361CD|nr:conjugal transfer protein [Streptomyces lincolnensis]MCD7443740.1 conjugal transfer protein [Streptomyces lincolnensis]
MNTPQTRRSLTRTQKGVLIAAFVPMLATGVAGGIGTFSNIGHVYGQGTALGALAAGEGATAVLALVLLGLTMLGQSSPHVVRAGLWALPAAASVMAAMAAPDAARTVIYALTPMGMSVSAKGMAFLARRIVVHVDGRDAEAERRAADLVQALAYHQGRAANHPSDRVKWWSERKSWRLARRVGVGDVALGSRLLEVQRDRVTAGANASLAAMFGGTLPAPALDPTRDANAEESTETVRNQSTADLPESTPSPITATVVRVPDPVPVDCTKSVVPLKPVRAIESAPIDPAATARDRVLTAVPLPKDKPVVAAESTRPRGATGRVPEAARSPRPKRTPAELLAEARTVTAGWPDAKVTAEGIRREVHTSPANARMLRDTILAERAEAA